MRKFLKKLSVTGLVPTEKPIGLKSYRSSQDDNCSGGWGDCSDCGKDCKSDCNCECPTDCSG